MDAGRRYDVIILGGGCAGLSLAVELVEQGFEGRLLIVEPRTAYERDRTWCYWSLLPHSFQDCVSHRWSRWSIRAPSRWIPLASDTYTYDQIPAERFYRSASSRLGASPGVSLWTGTRAESPRALPRGLEVMTDRGPVRGDLVFDSRPPRLVETAPKLTQHFLGWHLIADADAFDPATVTLMDFWAPPDGEVSFFYVLPYSKREALVESTFLSPRPLFDTARCRRALQDYLRERYGVGGFEVRYQERGAIPMGATAPCRDRLPAGCYPIGLRGGLVRPSTGYAFLAIQRWSQTAARAVIAGEPARIPARPYSAISRWVDGIFIRRLLEAPETAPETFCDLFRDTGVDATVRFLCDEGRIGDYLQVIRALPTRPFLETALKDVFARRSRAAGVQPLRLRGSHAGQPLGDAVSRQMTKLG